MLTDPIADFLNRLKNASHARRREVVLLSSRMLKAIADLLASKHFVESVYEEKPAGGNRKELHVTLRADRDPLEPRRVSRPGQRIYVSAGAVKRVRSGMGIGIYSTSRGVLPDEEVRKQKIGGEYICEIY